MELQTAKLSDKEAALWGSVRREALATLVPPSDKYAE